MFDYKQFEDELVTQMESTLEQLLEEYNDIYIFSLDIANDMGSAGIIANTYSFLEEQASPGDEDYYYFKYCEEEWDIWESGNFNKIKDNMSSYLENNHKKFSKNSDGTYIYTELFYEHSSKIIESCINALIRFKTSACNGLLLTLNIREFLDEDERIEIFKKLNSKEAAAEYSEYIDEFA